MAVLKSHSVIFRSLKNLKELFFALAPHFSFTCTKTVLPFIKGTFYLLLP